MSKRKEIIILAAPEGLSPSRSRDGQVAAREMFCSPGHVCTYCKGNGWFWSEDEQGESTKEDCPVCKGSGELDAVVTVEWKESNKE